MKKVRFTEDTKKHDGLSESMYLLDEVTYDFFCRPQNRYKTLNSYKNLTGNKIYELRDNLLNLANKAKYGVVRILPCGGGRGGSVSQTYTQWLVNLSINILRYI